MKWADGPISHRPTITIAPGCQRLFGSIRIGENEGRIYLGHIDAARNDIAVGFFNSAKPVYVQQHFKVPPCRHLLLLASHSSTRKYEQ